MPTNKPSIRVDPADFRRLEELGTADGLDNNDVVAIALQVYAQLDSDQRQILIDRRRHEKRQRDGRRFNYRHTPGATHAV